MLSCTFHAHAALKLAPILPQKSQEMQVRTICSSTAKTSKVTLMFLHYFNNNNYFLLLAIL